MINKTLVFSAILLTLLAGCASAPVATPTALPPTSAPTAPPTATAPPPAPTAIPPTPTETPVPATPTPLPPLSLSSDAFEPEGDLPVRYGEIAFSVPVQGGTFVCTGSGAEENLSPALSWANVPPEAQSLALVMGDQLSYAYPDIPPDVMFGHWVVYNLPPTAAGLPEGVTAEELTAQGAAQAHNHYPPPNDGGYGGPCPPRGEKHLYVFTLYALDTLLDLPPETYREEFLSAVEGHVLAEATLKGYYTGQ